MVSRRLKQLEIRVRIRQSSIARPTPYGSRAHASDQGARLRGICENLERPLRIFIWAENEAGRYETCLRAVAAAVHPA